MAGRGPTRPHNPRGVSTNLVYLVDCLEPGQLSRTRTTGRISPFPYIFHHSCDECCPNLLLMGILADAVPFMPISASVETLR